MRKIILFCVLLALMVTGCGEKQAQSEMMTASNFQLDTLVTVNLYGYEDESVFDDVFDEIDRLEKILSRKYPGSDLDRLAKNSGKDFIEVSPDTILLLMTGHEYSKLSGGLFDVSIGPLVSLWNIREGSGHFPSGDELEQAMSLVNHEEILLNGKTAMLKNTGMEVDFGGIAKGYIADQVKAFLMQRGVRSGIINLGGNVVLIGGRPSGENFRIGIQDPDGATGAYMGVVEISDKSLVTSGPYERFFTYEGKKYHHILDPLTGFPAFNDLIQVTVISNESMTGDALSTALFLLGLEEGMALADRMPGVSAIFVTNDKKVHLSNGFNEVFYIENTEYSMWEETL